MRVPCMVLLASCLAVGVGQSAPVGTAYGPVPVLAVVGRREAEERSLVLRRLPGREQETLPLAEAIARLAAEATPPDLAASA